MKKALIVLLSLSLILTVFAFIFFDDYDTKLVGLSTVRYKTHDVDEKVYLTDYNSNYPLPGAFQYIIDDTFVLSIDFDVGNYEEGYTPAGYYFVKGYISYIVDDVTNPSGQIVFACDPFPVMCKLYYNEAITDDTDLDTVYILLEYYEVNFDSFTFFGVINNCSSLYWENSLKFDDVDNIIDFGIYILDFIKSLFVLIGKIFYAVGYFFS